MPAEGSGLVSNEHTRNMGKRRGHQPGVFLFGALIKTREKGR